ncbi:MAG: glycoside hydrolase family 88 protein [Spirochaetes bacterium]|nr:glycoside hydrolase family 88 protein [Spirochaetota bacterium]
MNSTPTLPLAETIWKRFRKEVAIHNYSEILALHALARMGTHGDPRFLEPARTELAAFLDGRVPQVHGAFRLYRVGGNASAWLLLNGKLEGRDGVLAQACRDLVAEHPRTRLGLFTFPNRPETLWIDAAFAVCPFLAMVGVALKNDAWVDEAIRQILLLRGILLDGNTGLFRQAVGFSGPGVRSHDLWSRGNGWAAIALCELACVVPTTHPMGPTLRALFIDHVEACRRTQDGDGLWHQQMDDRASYVETSGSGLILYAMGRGLETKLLGAETRAAFEKGLGGYLKYLSPEGAVDQTCTGCLSPKDGSVEAYKDNAWRLNDEHAFGPAMLAFSQAHLLGIKAVPGAPTGRDSAS